VSDLAGSLAPVEDCYRPDLSPPGDLARSVHRAVATALAEAGVDRIVCETFPHPGEARIAVEEATKTGLPTWVALTAGPDGGLLDPHELGRAARDCVRAGAAAVLVCCTSARLTLPYLEEVAKARVQFGAYASAGGPSDGIGWGAPRGLQQPRSDVAGDRSKHRRWLLRDEPGTHPHALAHVHSAVMAAMCR
jgi:S-methylmethionine-dependent homocysteine/selenocysteine methylase